MRAAAALAVLAALLAAGCASSPGPGPQPPPGAAPPQPGFDPLVKLATDKGDIYIEVFPDRAPLTVANFLHYVTTHFYDGTKLTRVVGPSAAPPDGFIVQFGDPLTRDPTVDRSQWGQGDPNLVPIPDEFNPSLRYDAAGVVGMVRPPDRPNGATSQFFITLAPEPGLNDVNAAFGKVVGGMDVVRALGDLSTDSGGHPVDDVVVRSATVLDAQRDPADVRHGVRLWWPYVAPLNTTGNHTVTAAFVVRNDGNVREAPALTLEAPPNWTARVVFPPDLNVSAGDGEVVFFDLASPPNATDGAVTVRAQLGNATANATLPVRVRALGREAVTNAPVLVQYVGLMPDGRLFDTSFASLALNDSVPKYGPVFQARPAQDYAPLGFTIGKHQVVDGFEHGVLGLFEGESRAVALLPEQAYGPTGTGPLAGRSLDFVIEFVTYDLSQLQAQK